MRTALQGREDKLGFQLRKRKNRIVPPITVTNMDFVDDIALVSECINDAQEMLTRVEKSGKKLFFDVMVLLRISFYLNLLYISIQMHYAH